MDGYVTTEEFVGILWQALSAESVGAMELPEREPDGAELGAKEPYPWTNADKGMALARQHGWVETQDLLEAKGAVKRQTAARILHEFLWRELGEKDLTDISSAAVLKDLYDCHACVNHIAQVYSKGLMPAVCEGLFGMRECVTTEQAGAIAEKVEQRFQAKVRKEAELETWKQSEKVDAQTTNRLDLAAAVAFLESHPDAIHIDVRTAFEYANGHPQGAVNLPLMQLLEHPERVSDDKNACVLLGCDGGYRSEMAATCLKDAGFGRVYHYRFSDN